jgi:hypothetical protein
MIYCYLYLFGAVSVWIASAMVRIVRVLRYLDNNGITMEGYNTIARFWRRVNPAFMCVDGESFALLVGLFWPLFLLGYMFYCLWWVLSRGFVGVLMALQKFRVQGPGRGSLGGKK